MIVRAADGDNDLSAKAVLSGVICHLQVATYAENLPIGEKEINKKNLDNPW